MRDTTRQLKELRLNGWLPLKELTPEKIVAVETNRQNDDKPAAGSQTGRGVPD